MVAGVTVIVDILESRFSLSLEKLTCNSSCSASASSEVAGEAAVPGVAERNNGLGSGDAVPEVGCLTMLKTSSQRGLDEVEPVDPDVRGIGGNPGDAGGVGRPGCTCKGAGLCGGAKRVL